MYWSESEQRIYTKNQLIQKYSRNNGNELPTISFSTWPLTEEMLAILQLEPVVEQSKPAVNTDVETAVKSSTPARINGVMTIEWSVVPHSQGKLDKIAADKKQQWLDRISAARYVKEISNIEITLPGDKVFLLNGTREAKGILLDAIQALSLLPEEYQFIQSWKSADGNFLTLTIDELKLTVIQANQYVNQCFTEEETLSNAVKDGSITEEMFNNVYPPNNVQID